MPWPSPLAGRFGPDGVHGQRLPLPPSPLQVWAVEDVSVQLTWGDLPPGPITVEVRAGGAGASAEHPGGPGGLVVEGLRPGTDHQLRVRWDGGQAVLAATTLAPPPGGLLARVATLSDLHLGATHFGFLGTMGESGYEGRPMHALHGAAAAMAEAAAWGADLVVLKGDLVEDQDPDHFALLAELLDRSPPVPVVLLPGNHEVNGATDVELPRSLGTREAGYVTDVAHVDLPGVRVVGGNTTVPPTGVGSLDGVGRALVERAGEAAGPALVLLHHQLQRHRLATHWPPGVTGPAARRFLDRLAAVNPSALVSSGHTHRNRARRHGPLLVTEVGSTKDWPGVWAGYAVHEGGIRQVIRRTQARRAIGWSEYTRAAVLGLWSRWSPGHLHQRCLVHPWPGR